MPITVQDLCQRALRKAGVIDISEPADGEDFAVALDALNDMLAAWKLSGVDVNYSQLSGGSTFPLADEFIEGTVHNLAARLSVDYQAPLGFDPDDWFRKIQAAYMVIDTVALDAGLKNFPSQLHRRIL